MLKIFDRPKNLRFKSRNSLFHWMWSWSGLQPTLQWFKHQNMSPMPCRLLGHNTRRTDEWFSLRQKLSNNQTNKQIKQYNWVKRVFVQASCTLEKMQICLKQGVISPSICQPTWSNLCNKKKKLIFLNSPHVLYKNLTELVDLPFWLKKNKLQSIHVAS